MDNGLMSPKDQSNLKDTLLYKLRLNKLSKSSRSLQKHGIIDTNGFLTIEGAQVFLDALWQQSKDVQEAIAAELDKLDKDKKNASK